MHAYLTHPQVAVDPAVAVPRWGLSDLGRDRARLLARSRFAARFSRIVSSEETKAVETAREIADVTGARLEIRPDFHENDRSSTGYLPPDTFERMADAFFAKPETSVLGWERAIDAQARVLAAASAAVAEGGGPVLFVGHGAVGTLLMCALAGLDISRRHDQKPGGGCVFRFDFSPPAVIHPWRPLEEIAAHDTGPP